jgi:hypothetical protein
MGDPVNNCGGCRHWLQDGTWDAFVDGKPTKVGIGSCKRYPPVLLWRGVRRAEQQFVPHTIAVDFCGEFARSADDAG